MDSGIFDKNGKKVQIGDIIIFPYVDPMGNIHEDTPDFEAIVEFKHGCFGYTLHDFSPLMEWSKKKKGEYIGNYGNKTIITDEYIFWIKPQSEEK